MASSKEYLTEHSLYFLLESSIIDSNLNAFSDEIAVQNMRNELAHDYDGKIAEKNFQEIISNYYDAFDGLNDVITKFYDGSLPSIDSFD